jgi:hypothetical protein
LEPGQPQRQQIRPVVTGRQGSDSLAGIPGRRLSGPPVSPTRRGSEEPQTAGTSNRVVHAVSGLALTSAADPPLNTGQGSARTPPP